MRWRAYIAALLLVLGSAPGWAAYPTIRYDATSGSDTLSSGAGPDTAVNSTTESSQAYSGDGAGGGTQTVITLDSASDLSGVSTNGDHILWLNSPSGDRHLFRIVAVSDGGDTVTVDTAPDTAISSGSPVNWAIGGWRQTLENDTSNEDWNDVLQYWTLEFKVGTYTVVSDITADGSGSGGYLTFQAEDGAASKPIIQGNSGITTATFNGNLYVHFKGLKLTTAVANKYAVYTSSGSIFEDCEITSTGTGGVGWYGNSSSGYGNAFYRCSFHSCSSYGLLTPYRGRELYFGCKFYSNGDHGAFLNTTDPHSASTFVDCQFFDNVGAGLRSAGGYPVNIINCVFEDNGTDGVEFSQVDPECNVQIINSIFANNTNYGIDWPSGKDFGVGLNFNNAYYSNGSGQRNNWPAGTDDVTLTADPFTNAVSNDYTLNNNNPGGAELRGMGAVGDTDQDGSRDNYPDIGALQHEYAGGAEATIIILED